MSSNAPPPLSRSITAAPEVVSLPPPSFAPLARAKSSGVDHAYEFAATPTCPPPQPTNCCSQFPEPPPSPPRLRRTDSASNYAVPNARSAYDDTTNARLSRIERDLLELTYLVNSRLPPAIAPRSSPVSRQIASPAPPATITTAAPDMEREFGM